MDLTNGLVHYWKLDETTGSRVDSVGGVDLAVSTGDVTYTTGRSGNAARFVGNVNQWLKTATAVTGLTGSGFSISLWWSDTNGIVTPIATVYDQADQDDYLWFETGGPAGYLYFKVYFRSSGAVQDSIDTGQFVNNGSLYHLVFTYSDVVNEMKLYVNGSLLRTETITLGAMATAHPLTIGGDGVNTSTTGDCDEVGIWNRVLTLQEVQAIYAAGTVDTDASPGTGNVLKYEKAVQEDLNIGTGLVWVTNPGGGELRATQIGLHTFARGQKEYTATWSPGAITAGSKASTTVTVPDAAVGDFVIASHDKMVTNDLRISGHVSAANTAKVVIHNPSTNTTVTPASGTVSVLVFPSIGASATPEPVPVEVVFSWLETSESASITFSFTLEESMLGSDSQLTVLWNWGDGNSNSYTATAYDIGTYSKSHTYSIPPDATFTVTLTLTSDLYSGYDSADVTTDYTNGTSGSSA